MLSFYSTSPDALLHAFKEKVALGNKEGGIATWTMDKDGDFIHSSPQLKDLGYARPTVVNDGKEKCLRFAIFWRNETTAKEQKLCYRELSGNLLATFIDHLSDQFSQAVHKDVRE
ncbi:hypothetical protein [Stenotrophomonas sp. TD3]|uniref:hypothetical protein n=1 Tax=Stenotrophomonas sp. TD3 TaxID=1641707 RepID=UPI00095224D5|nr:hypothetical protein [Stenotrophomonas sp. TD3]